MRFLVTTAVLFLLFSCNSGSDEQETQNEQEQATPAAEESAASGWEDVMPAVVEINSYDGDRILESGQGFFVGENLIVTKYSLVSQADNVKVSPLDTDEDFTVTQYAAFDRINDLIILQTDTLQRQPIGLYQGQVPNSAKSSYISLGAENTIQLFTGKVLNLTNTAGTRLYRLTNRIRPSIFGAPILVSNKKAIGLAFSDVVNFQEQGFAIPSFFISELLTKKLPEPKSLESLNSFSSEQVAAENRQIIGLVLETDMGDVTIRLFNETPQYRDNFIRLVKENFYDSLLIHRVIADFGIQTGAADSRYAEEGDVVGWKGPGYTLPAHIVPGLYHKRGMIGVPRKPDTQNSRRRSEGSQFYIVSGRKYFDEELDEIEEANDYEFTPEQREVYKTIGGAPHLDGSYTIFGEVVSGMEVVDKIVEVETNRQWRPVEDIRLKNIRILE